MTPEKSKESKADAMVNLVNSLSDATDSIIEEQENGDWLITNINAFDEAIIDWHNKQKDKLIDRVLDELLESLRSVCYEYHTPAIRKYIIDMKHVEQNIKRIRREALK